MRRFVFVLLLVAVFAAPSAVLAYNDDTKAPTAFVEGTRDYSIPYLEKTRKEVLSKYFTDAQLKSFDTSLAELKNHNRRMLERIKMLEAQGGFLKDNDSEFNNYRLRLENFTEYYLFPALEIARERAERRNNLPPR